jgi:hypothetical protein
MTTETTYKYGEKTYITEHEPGMPDWLVRVKGQLCDWPDLDWVSCDYEGCFEPEVVDIVEGTSTELRPMYLDLRHEVVMCRKCYEAGKHMDDGEAPDAH